jgi:hypothetical protein
MCFVSVIYYCAFFISISTRNTHSFCARIKEFTCLIQFLLLLTFKIQRFSSFVMRETQQYRQDRCMFSFDWLTRNSIEMEKMNILRTLTHISALKIYLEPIDFSIHSLCCHHSKLRVRHSIEISAILWLNIWIWYSRVTLLRARTNEWQIHSIAVVCFWSNQTTDLRDLSRWNTCMKSISFDHLRCCSDNDRCQTKFKCRDFTICMANRRKVVCVCVCVYVCV